MLLFFPLPSSNRQTMMWMNDSLLFFDVTMLVPTVPVVPGSGYCIYGVDVPCTYVQSADPIQKIY